MRIILEVFKFIWIIGMVCACIALIKEFVSEGKSEKKVYEKYIKRMLDCFLSSVALIVLFPFFLIVAILVRINLGAPVIFSQERPGKNEIPFKLYKFRSMTSDRDKDGELLPDNLRLSKFGKILRNTSLDELPEIFNIFKGDMSIIGPRPLLVRYLPYYSAEERHRHDVRPGLTGLAQIKGRNFISWEEIFEYDLLYVNDCTFKNDLYIFFATINKVIKHADVSDATQGVKDSSGRKVHDALDVERANNGSI